MGRFWTFAPKFEAPLTQNGPASDVPTTVVVQHQVQPSEDREDPWRQADLPVLEEEAHRAQVPHDRTGPQGRQAFQARRQVQAVTQAEEGLQSVRRCVEPQGCQGKDCPGFPDRGAEDCGQGVEEPGKVNYQSQRTPSFLHPVVIHFTVAHEIKRKKLWIISKKKKKKKKNLGFFKKKKKKKKKK